MKLDILPIKKLAPSIRVNVALDFYKKSLFCFEDQEGRQITTIFRVEELENFCSSKTVSEMINVWEKNSTSEIQFVEYVYNIELKSNILHGDLIPVVALKDMLGGLVKKGDNVHLRSILYNEDTVLVNALAWVHNEDFSHQMLIGCPDELLNSPIGTTIQHPKNPEIFITKAYDEVVAPKGSFKEMWVVLTNGGFPTSRFGSIPISDLFKKL